MAPNEYEGMRPTVVQVAEKKAIKKLYSNTFKKVFIVWGVPKKITPTPVFVIKERIQKNYVPIDQW